MPIAKSHSSNIISLPSSWSPAVDRKSTKPSQSAGVQLRNLATIEKTDSVSTTNTTSEAGTDGTLQSVGNEKIALDDKSTYFLVNAFSVIVIHLLVWVVSYFAKNMDP